MALVRLEAHGVGPFEDLFLDLSDGQGQPHLGPHVLAGVNGSGKTTALRTIAWTAAAIDRSFPDDDWDHYLRPGSKALATLHTAHDVTCYLCAALSPNGSHMIPPELAREVTIHGPLAGPQGTVVWEWSDDPFQVPDRQLLIVGYFPSDALRHLRSPISADLSIPSFRGALSFSETVDNARAQTWLKDLHARLAINRQRNEPVARLEGLARSVDNALTEITGRPVRLDVSTEYGLEPIVRFRAHDLNFSQLPQGVRSITGILVDFLNRLDTRGWSPDLGNRRPAILLIDEIDAHLHPRWQRTILPALKKALPEVQIIVTTHSPFVITSCPGARIHVLEVDEQGRASAHPPVDAPIGESINATMKDIFGVSSRFDIQTERELDRWNELKKKEYTGNLSPAESRELAQLIRELSERSQELRSIVGLPSRVPDSIVQALLSQ